MLKKSPTWAMMARLYLNADSKESMNDARNPKRVNIKKMETFTFYKDAAGKTSIACNAVMPTWG